MDYRKIYNNLVKRGQDRVLEGYSEKHHIVPRCLGGTDERSNLVTLTPEEHYLCHLLLVKIYPNSIRLIKAAMFMTASNSSLKRNNKVYGWLRRQYSASIKGPGNPNYNGKSRIKYIAKHGTPEVNKDYITVEWRDQIRKRMVGSKNPIAGIKPWKHPRATDYSKSIWRRADVLYKLWKDNSQPSYSKLYYLDNGKCYTNESGVIGPYMNMIKYFRNGWVPSLDNEWNKL